MPISRSRAAHDSTPAGNNQRTVQAYEAYAPTYTNAVSDRPVGLGKTAIDLLLGTVPKGGEVLEIGSGPGWDADYVEAHGVAVRRSDVTFRFRQIQEARGKVVRELDVLTDELGGPYDGIMALYVLQHIDRASTGLVLGKISRALRPGGVFLCSLREGSGEVWESSEVSGDYHVVMRSETEMRECLAAVGLHIGWTAHEEDSDGAWLMILARK